VSLRIDHTFSNRVSVFGRYNRSPSQNIFRFDSLSSIKTQEVNTTTFTAGANWLVSGNLSNFVRFNYSRQTTVGANRIDSFGGAPALPPSDLIPPGSSVNDSFAVFGLTFIGDRLTDLQLGLDAENRVGQWNVVDDFASTMGSHQLKFGADYRRLPV